MPPEVMMLISTMAPMLMEKMFPGNKGEFKSTYSKGARSGLEDALEQLKSMKGNADITQNQNYQSGQDWLQSLYNDPAFFDKFEAPLQRQFEEQTIPDLANRFASQGSGGSLGSTGFRNQLAREGSNLHTNIAALRGGLQQQGVNQSLQYAQQPAQNYMNLLGIGTQPTQNVYQGPTANPLSNLFSGFSGGFSQGYGHMQGQKFAGQSPGTV